MSWNTDKEREKREKYYELCRLACNKKEFRKRYPNRHLCRNKNKEAAMIYECYELDDDTLEINIQYEYTSVVNFCPLCGYESKVQFDPNEEQE